ncbi:MAG TPA: glyoxalase/bleomycin resistance/extradiol dioxygenase family protein [Candidatus Atribacteria bacterium]|nr:glyoxalase/bleomycin resistance/extradiol dioxygenase family protein [Candidatus Atribacteria bacterium]
MIIEHVAIWTGDLERLKRFYIKYFNCIAGKKYRNESNDFDSYFLSFDNSARLELMQMPSVPKNLNDPKIQYEGIIHIAISVGSKEKVVKITEKLRSDGYTIVSEPQTTGDGYFESCALDPDGNRIEITV